MVIDDYIRYDKRDLYQVRRRVRQHLNPALGKIRAADFGTEHINSYITKRKREKAANATINRELAIIRRAFGLGAKEHPPKVGRITRGLVSSSRSSTKLYGTASSVP